MRRVSTVAFALVLTAAATPVLAQNLVVPIDHSVRLGVKGQAASVVVGNPQVADVTVVDTHTVFVSGRGYGETDVVVLDQAGRTLYSGDVIVSAADSGRASVYRGQERTDFACAPSCSITTRSPTGPSKGGAGESAGGGGAPANPLGSLAATVMGGASNGLPAVGHAVGGPG